MKRKTIGRVLLRLFKYGIYCSSVAVFVIVVLVFLERLEEMETRSNSHEQPLKPAAVHAHTVDMGAVTEWVVGEGRAEALIKRYLQFERPGKVVYIARDKEGEEISEGSGVSGPWPGRDEGQLLAKLDTRDQESVIAQHEVALVEAKGAVEIARAALFHVKSELRITRASLARKAVLREKEAISLNEYEEFQTKCENVEERHKAAKAGLDIALAKEKSVLVLLERAKRDLEKFRIVAPVSGVIARLSIKKGDYFDPEDVIQGTEKQRAKSSLITIIDQREMEIVIDIPQFDGMKIEKGQEVIVVQGGSDWFSEDAAGGVAECRGIIHSVSPSIDPVKRSIRIKARLKQVGRYTILDGMYVSCWIAVSKKEKVLRVPLNSLMYDDNIPWIYTIENGLAHKRFIKTGFIDNKYAEVIDGLESGDVIALKGKKRLSDGYPVRIVTGDRVAGNE